LITYIDSCEPQVRAIAFITTCSFWTSFFLFSF
jgi:hypothetical protein